MEVGFLILVAGWGKGSELRRGERLRARRALLYKGIAPWVWFRELQCFALVQGIALEYCCLIFLPFYFV